MLASYMSIILKVKTWIYRLQHKKVIDDENLTTYLSVDVQNLDQDQACEGYHHDVSEAISEHKQTKHQDCSALEHALP